MKRALTFEKFRVWQVVVPIRREILEAPPATGVTYSHNLTFGELPIHLVEGVTSEGFTAVGECGRGTTPAMVEAALRDLLGRNLLAAAVPTVWMTPCADGGLPGSYPLWSWQHTKDRSYSVLEPLWLDAVAKAAGMPVAQFLGGAVRHEVLTDFWANRPTAPTLRALIREAIGKGLRGIKIKSDGAGDTVQSLTQIAADLPSDFRVTVDPMCAWRSLRESRRLFTQLAGLPCAVQVEDPFPYLVVEDWRAARQFDALTIICHARDEGVLREALRGEIADAYNLGGPSMYEFRATSAVAEFWGKDCWLGSALELGVWQHLRLHAAATARNCLLASDLQSEWVREHTLVKPRMQYRGAFAVVPDGPGLGIDLDHDAIERYTKKTFEIG